MDTNDLRILTNQLTDIGAFIGDLIKLDELSHSGLIAGINLAVALHKISNDLQIIYDQVQDKINSTSEEPKKEESNI